jgi:mono/diheme cytochrome c family protein
MLIAATTSGATDEQAGSISEGSASYMQFCASCHGPEAKGDGPVAPVLRKQPTDLAGLSLQHAGQFPRDEVMAVLSRDRVILEHGTREMPVWGQRLAPSGTGVDTVYARRRLDLLLGYLESIQRPAEEPSPSPAGSSSE